MAAHQQKYKEKKFGFGDANENRFIRTEKHEELRKKQRDKVFNQNRNISTSITNKPGNKGVETASVNRDRETRLMRWKEQREKRRLEQMKKRPPFIVGKVRHKIYSPICNVQTVVPSTAHQKIHKQTALKLIATKPIVSPPKRITRATEKRLRNKMLVQKTVTDLGKTLPSISKEQKTEKKQSFAPENYKFKALAGMSGVSLFGKVTAQDISTSKSEFMSTSITMDSKNSRTEFIKEINNGRKDSTPKINRLKETDHSMDSSLEPVSLKLSLDDMFTCSNENDDANKVEKLNNSVAETFSSKHASTPNDSSSDLLFFSPYVISSRGKSNARKEQQIKRGFSLNRSKGDDIPTKDTVMKTLNISAEEEERTAQYFRFLLNRETDRLNEFCEMWTDIKEVDTTTEDGQYEINQTIGQTNLLMNKKFQRFRKLVADCETGKGEMLVTCKDLQGFWDMMYIEVKDCDARFERLEKLRSNNWIEEQTSFPKAKPVKKKNVTKKKPLPTKESSLRAFLAQKKKNIAQKTDRYPNNMIENNENNPDISNKTRTSFAPVSKKKTSLSLLEKSRFSITSQNVNNPLTVIKVSQMCKTPDVQLDNTISYINSNQTPGKGILKATKNMSEVKPSVKSSKVNFDDHVVSKELPVDEQCKLKSDLATALERIDSFDFDSADEVVIHAERKLNFDDDSSEASEESDDDSKQNSELAVSIYKKLTKVPSVKIQTATPSKYSELDTTYTPSPERKLTRQNAIDENDEDLILDVTLTQHEAIAENTDSNTFNEKTPKRVSMYHKEETNSHDESVRVLRNRIITTVDTPRPRRSFRKMSVGVEDSEYKENKTPMKARRKNYVEVAVEDEKMNSSENGDRRKSRRSVKFSEKDCGGCVSSKPVLPRTPHVKRRVKSAEKKRSIIPAYVTSWET
ncbi:uncharacterized protein LOC114873322 [Osmia bicornis bicornis]|uniref:uncharacterized protein LOC114873322 n=1 Tax=Osmia bicornis bicornis TaxID=1437191 RepID=UPI001EAE8D88|nr:uncharacterized protein LOC114873322 [Osmia bicornis bicornis]XP_029037376.2 uncharacterized protein LOC114873322 [Osmia bicornis bicornis]